jgi:hypothetical protein
VRSLAAGIVCLAGLGGLGSAPGCGGAVDIGNFLGDPFGDITTSVRDLDEDELNGLMSELMLRFRFYLDLRAAIPFESLAPEECISNVHDSGDAFDFLADVPCVFGEQADPAEGEIAVTQQQLSADPGVFRFAFDYRDVSLGELEVDGVEAITETEGEDGASVRKLDITQNGIDLKYEFRAGLLDGETPVFDYELSGPDGTVLARVTNPTSAGGFVTVFLTGLDGMLACEVRNSLWTPERLPRGSCDNGVVFGLP